MSKVTEDAKIALETNDYIYRGLAYSLINELEQTEKENSAFKQANETLLKTSLNQETENDKLDSLNMALDLENKEQQKTIDGLNEQLRKWRHNENQIATNGSFREMKILIKNLANYLDNALNYIPYGHNLDDSIIDEYRSLAEKHKGERK